VVASPLKCAFAVLGSSWPNFEARRKSKAVAVLLSLARAYLRWLLQNELLSGNVKGLPAISAEVSLGTGGDIMKAKLGCTAFIVCLVAGAVNLSGSASAASPKFDACLKEAEAKGLYVSNTGGRAVGGRANAAMASQRKAFMKECMAKK
jgi:hypothetical protein